jgi:hypothetical protein
LALWHRPASSAASKQGVRAAGRQLVATLHFIVVKRLQTGVRATMQRFCGARGGAALGKLEGASGADNGAALEAFTWGISFWFER